MQGTRKGCPYVIAFCRDTFYGYPHVKSCGSALTRTSCKPLNLNLNPNLFLKV